MESEVKVSVIVPFYNAAAMLERSLLGALRQSLKEIEVYAVDDGSTDDSYRVAERIARCDTRLKLLSVRHGGCGAARNAALPYVSGKYLFFLDADDDIHPDLLKKMAEKMERESAQIAFCRFKNIDLRGRDTFTPYEYNLEAFTSDINDIQYLLMPKPEGKPHGTPTVLWSVFRVLFRSEIVFRRKIIFPEIAFAEDFLFLTSYLNYCRKACLVDECLYAYTRQDDGRSNHVKGFEKQYNCVCSMILQRARNMLLHNAMYSSRHREKIYKVFELSIAYNMILNALCAPNYVTEYDKTMAVISSIIAPGELQTYRSDIGEKRYALLVAAHICDADGIRDFLKSANT